MTQFGQQGNFGQSGNFGQDAPVTLTLVTADVSPTYSIKARVEASLTVNYNIGFFAPITAPTEVIAERQPEDLDTFAQRVWDDLAPIQMNSKDLNHYVGGIGELFQEIDDYAHNSDWDMLMDVNRVPTKGLGWLGQFVGVQIDHDDSDEGMRQQVRGHDRWGRGTPFSIIGPASHWIPANSTMYMSERNPSPYHVTFIFVDKPVTTQLYADLYDIFISYHKLRVEYASYADVYGLGRGDWTKVVDTLDNNKPAGIQYTYINTTTTLYVAIWILLATYQNVYDNYLTYQLLFTAPFPDITLEIPTFRQLVSARYYRNIYNQFETYLNIWDSYMKY